MQVVVRSALYLVVYPAGHAEQPKTLGPDCVQVDSGSQGLGLHVSITTPHFKLFVKGKHNNTTLRKIFIKSKHNSLKMDIKRLQSGAAPSHIEEFPQVKTLWGPEYPELHVATQVEPYVLLVHEEAALAKSGRE